MERHATERGNTLLVATVLVLGMTVMSLGAAKFLRQQTSEAADLRFAGYPTVQALYAAEKGINALLYQNNVNASESLEVPTPAVWIREIAYPGITIKQRVGYRFAELGPIAPGIFRFEVTGEAAPIGGSTGWSTITRTIRVDVASGSAWTIRRYEQK